MLQLWMLHAIAISKRNVGLSTFLLIEPQIAEHFLAEAEKRQAVFPTLIDLWMKTQQVLS